VNESSFYTSLKIENGRGVCQPMWEDSLGSATSMHKALSAAKPALLLS